MARTTATPPCKECDGCGGSGDYDCEVCDGSGDARCDCGNVAAYAVDPHSFHPDFVCWECHLFHFLPCLPSDLVASDLEATP